MKNYRYIALHKLLRLGIVMKFLLNSLSLCTYIYMYIVHRFFCLSHFQVGTTVVPHQRLVLVSG